ncbi:hypothetical protein CBR_g4819 [Chara braunii]|uniref:Uncharacterized protein n=1 Tax=Chara braunii TaxID=69332 RepID=A0A388KIV7_CHABU|nr:hypothetical protein CBR_g4819 [Chara braunii]|eukprot:GBG69991.1 hypothetical protein CBR_g4819 [Chara braunii]
MMMRLTFAVGGRVGDWTTVVPKTVVDVYGDEAGQALVKEWEEMSVVENGMASNLAFGGGLGNYRILDRANGTLLPIERSDIFRNWGKEKLRASFGREHRLQAEDGLDVLFELFNRNVFCVVDKLSGKRKIWVIEKGVVEKMMDHWILGELLAGFVVARMFGRTIDVLNKDELRIVKEACEAENRAWKGRGRWEFAALGLIIAFTGSSKRELVTNLLKGMGAIEWEGFGIAEVKALIARTLKEASEEDKKTLQIEELFKFGEGAWISSLSHSRLGLDFSSDFAGGGGANLNFAVNWCSVTECRVPNARPIFIPLSPSTEPVVTNQELASHRRKRQDGTPISSAQPRTSPPNSRSESGRYFDMS